MTEAEVEKLRSRGISDAIILEMQREDENQSPTTANAGPATAPQSGLLEIDPSTPSTVFQQAQAAGVPTAGQSQTFGQTVLELGGLVADNAGKIATVLGGGGALLGANQLRKGMQASAAANQATAAAQQATANAAMEQARAAQMQAQGVQQRFEARAAQQAAQQAASGPRILGPNGMPLQPTVQPAVPTVSAPPGSIAPGAVPGAAPAPAAQSPGVLARAGEVVRKLALDRVLPVAARAGGVAAGVLIPGNTGQNYGAQFPQAGPMRGMEINPNTGRPWTPQELQAYQQQFGG